MTLYEFNALDEMEQIETVWEHGVRLGNLRKGDQLLELYQVDAFYIELGGPADSIGYTHIRTFLNPDLLGVYLEQVKIEGV